MKEEPLITVQKTDEEVEKAERQIKESQIPYDYDTKEYPIEVLLYKFDSDKPEKSQIRIPNYQRNFIWKDGMQARFIESLLLGVPIRVQFKLSLCIHSLANWLYTVAHQLPAITHGTYSQV